MIPLEHDEEESEPIFSIFISRGIFHWKYKYLCVSWTVNNYNLKGNLLKDWDLGKSQVINFNGG